MNKEERDFSLWLLPEERLGASLQLMIDHLAMRFGAPAFYPHLTLLGQIKTDFDAADDLTTQLTDFLPSLSLRAQAIDHSHGYFRCLYVSVVSDSRLLAAYRQACRLFNTKPEFFRPHISLLYGKLSSMQRRRLISRLMCPPKPYP